MFSHAKTPMNVTPQPPRSYPREFQQVITEKSQNFVGREFIFTAITDFFHRYNRGYFTIIGAPGSGKSAILAKYVTENPHIVYYSAEVTGKNRAEEFLTTICTQLIEGMGVPDSEALTSEAQIAPPRGVGFSPSSSRKSATS